MRSPPGRRWLTPRPPCAHRGPAPRGRPGRAARAGDARPDGRGHRPGRRWDGTARPLPAPAGDARRARPDGDAARSQQRTGTPERLRADQRPPGQTAAAGRAPAPGTGRRGQWAGPLRRRRLVRPGRRHGGAAGTATARRPSVSPAGPVPDRGVAWLGGPEDLPQRLTAHLRPDGPVDPEQLPNPVDPARLTRLAPTGPVVVEDQPEGATGRPRRCDGCCAGGASSAPAPDVRRAAGAVISTMPTPGRTAPPARRTCARTAGAATARRR